MTQRAFRFGVGPAGLPADPVEWRCFAQRVEDLGYSTVSVGDHLDTRLAPIPAMVAAAEATTTLRVGALVFANDYRNPLVLAHELATVDILSEGRVEVGMGAGWLPADYARAGLSFDDAATRIERLSEGIVMLRQAFAGDTTGIDGRHYHVEDVSGCLRPVQEPSPPIVVGGGGRRILELAARQADIVGVNVNLRAGLGGSSVGHSASAEATEEKLGIVRDAAGDRFDELELEVYVHHVVVTDDVAAAAAHVGEQMGLTAEAVAASPHVLIGDCDRIVDELVEMRERFRFSYVHTSGVHTDTLAPVVDRLAGT